MDKRSSVAIVIPTHNRVAVLPRAVLSAVRQTYPAMEIVVVDDTSHDDNRRAINLLAAEYPDRHIRYLAVAPCPLAGSRNAGVKATHAEYITFLDDDDALAPSYLEEVVGKFETLDANYGAVGAGSLLIDQNGRVSYGTPSPESSERFWDGRVGNCWTFRRSVFENGIWFDEQFTNQEDRDFSIRFFAKYKASFVDKPLIRYTLRLARFKGDPSILWLNYTAEYDNAKRTFEKHYAVFQRGGPRALATAEIATAIPAGLAGMMKESRMHFRDSLRAQFSWQAFLYYVAAFFGIYGFTTFHYVKNRTMRFYRTMSAKPPSYESA